LLKVALTLREVSAKHYDEMRDCISHDWITRLSQWNFLPILIPNLIHDPASYLEKLKPDILILTGGENIGSSPKRDATEKSILKYALAKSLPTMGVCRGMQFINNHFGGKLSPIPGHAGTSHTVKFTAPLHDICGSHATVNSFHNFGILPNDLAEDLTSIATDEKGYIEAFFHSRAPLMGIMWHPERGDGQSCDIPLIQSLLGQIKR